MTSPLVLEAEPRKLESGANKKEERGKVTLTEKTNKQKNPPQDWL